MHTCLREGLAARDPAKPCSFAVTTPAGEHHLAAHDDALKDRWLDQLARVARGEALA